MSNEGEGVSDNTHRWKEHWERELEVARQVLEEEHPHLLAESMREHALRFKGLANYAGGHGCKECSGTGVQVYGSTATWRRGAGGQTMTAGVCDVCWGTGRTDKKGLDRRKFSAVLERMKQEGYEI